MGDFLAESNEPGYDEHNKLLQKIISPTIDAIEGALK